jgi:hypothetical protein
MQVTRRTEPEADWTAARINNKVGLSLGENSIPVPKIFRGGSSVFATTKPAMLTAKSERLSFLVTSFSGSPRSCFQGTSSLTQSPDASESGIGCEDYRGVEIPVT